jgi:hypothetical protein
MELKSKSIKVSKYNIEIGYTEGLEDMSPSEAYAIALFIDYNMPDIEPNDICTYIFAGMVTFFDEPLPFVFEIMYVTDGKPTLTDVCIVDMDEYLDLLNLNLTIKSNNENKYP